MTDSDTEKKASLNCLFKVASCVAVGTTLRICGPFAKWLSHGKDGYFSLVPLNFYYGWVYRNMMYLCYSHGPAENLSLITSAALMCFKSMCYRRQAIKNSTSTAIPSTTVSKTVKFGKCWSTPGEPDGQCIRFECRGRIFCEMSIGVY